MLCTGAEGMSFFFVWLRLSTMKQLDWYRNSSYQSKDIAHVQKTITQRIADKVRGLGMQHMGRLNSMTRQLQQGSRKECISCITVCKAMGLPQSVLHEAHASGRLS